MVRSGVRRKPSAAVLDSLLPSSAVLVAMPCRGHVPNVGHRITIGDSDG